ncbi:hypothetical protein P3T16_003047 [Paraburkholderia sp. GAS42]|jgi:hypothetical protein
MLRVKALIERPQVSNQHWRLDQLHLLAIHGPQHAEATPPPFRLLETFRRLRPRASASLGAGLKAEPVLAATELIATCAYAARETE